MKMAKRTTHGRRHIECEAKWNEIDGWMAMAAIALKGLGLNGRRGALAKKREGTLIKCRTDRRAMRVEGA